MADHHQPSGEREPSGAASLMGLFAPPPPPAPAARQQSEGSVDLQQQPPSTSQSPSPAEPISATLSVEDFGAFARSTEYNPFGQDSFRRDSAAFESSTGDNSTPLSSDHLAYMDELIEEDDVKTKPPPAPSRETAEATSERTPLLPNQASAWLQQGGGGSIPPINHTDKTPKTGSLDVRKLMSAQQQPTKLPPLPHTAVVSEVPLSMPPIPETSSASFPKQQGPASFQNRLYRWKDPVVAWSRHNLLCFSTWIGAFMFLLYHVVFCLAMGSAIIRPNGGASMLGLMTKMAALGIIFGGANYWWSIRDIPALYPTVDLFTAPFLANIAVIVDDVLHNDSGISDHDNDQFFLGTFTFLACTAALISGTLLVLASVFKLANLGAFLPFHILAGFFTAVGVLTWMLAFKVDTHGKGVGAVFFSGDWSLICHAIVHHAPSVAIAGIMKYLGPKSPFYAIGVVFASIAGFYVLLFLSGVSIESAIERGWLWSKSDLVYERIDKPIGFSQWEPPAPFGLFNSLILGKVHWGAVWKAMDTTAALGFLYMIRCSLHGAAMKKNVPNLRRVEKSAAMPLLSTIQKPKPHKRGFSEAVDVETSVSLPTISVGSTVIQAKPTSLSLKDILIQYGFSQFVCAAVGGFLVIPCVAASNTMFMLGAGHLAPQVGSVLALFVFYMTDFVVVAYIPKFSFSALLVLAFLDMFSTWFIKSWYKTKEKLEWLVVPLIVILAFVVGLLGAVFLGIAMSTFLFVASFFRSGVVKYVSSGVSTRSTIERPTRSAHWLDQNGDLIHILVLQNYLFFGNASSILSYIVSMFDEPKDEFEERFLPPIPKIVVIDLTLVTGMDTSSVDVFSEILTVLRKHDCKLFLSGVPTSLRQAMALGGVKPDMSLSRVNRKLRFFPSLDAAIGKAEDILLDLESVENESNNLYLREKGFRLALRHIDEQHEREWSKDLIEFESYTKPVEVDAGELLFGLDHERGRGLYFIESGVMKIERNADFTVSRSLGAMNRRVSMNQGSLNHLMARSSSIGQDLNKLKQQGAASSTQSFRLARIGPGWVIGTMEAITAESHPGSVVAVSHCKVHFLPFKTIEEVEEKNPKLVLKLFKLLSYLMARRQEVTIGQLATLHSIMSSPAQKKPLGRTSSYGTDSFYG